MAFFNLDQEMIYDSINNLLEEASYQASTEQMISITNKINEKIPGLIEYLTQSTAEAWKAEAIEAGGWGTKYAQAIKYETDGTSSTVYLDDKEIDSGSKKPYYMFAMMMEKGVKSWSIKDALLKSKKAKTGIDNDGNTIKYITIPFPVAAPRRKGQGKMQRRFGGREMSNAIKRIVQSEGSFTGTLPSGQEVSGLTQWRTKKFHSGYKMFLRVSSRSKGWQYPDIPPEPVYQSVLNQVNRIVSEAMQTFCRAIVKEFTT